MKTRLFSPRDYVQKVSIVEADLPLHGAAHCLACISVETDESLFLLATCYYRSGRVNEAHWLLNTKGAATHKSKFLLAKCAFELKQ